MEINIPRQHEIYRFFIDGIEYAVSACLSVNLFTIFTEAIEQGKSCKEAMALMLFEALDSCLDKRPSCEELLAHDDVLQGYISALLDDVGALKAEYKKLPQNESVYSRFETAMCNYTRNAVGKITSIAKEALGQPSQGMQEALAAFSEAIKSNIPQISLKALEEIKRVYNFADSFKPMFEGINNVVSEFSRAFSSAITNILPKIEIPTITEERKRELCDSYEQWGKYGWSVLPYAPIHLFNTAPTDSKEADKIALSNCCSDDISRLFKQFRENKCVKQSDISEAIHLFESKMYKSCSMIIFGMVDSKLVRAQGRKNRKVGKSAIDKFKDKLLKGTNIEQTFFYLLQYTNTATCLSQIYESYKDFDNEPNLINRNFVMHGMITRRVTRKDCLQLFLLYWNLLELIEFAK